MAKDSAQAVLDLATDFYLQSRDFNGLTAEQLCRQVGSWDELRPLVEQLIREGTIGVISSDVADNPHIIRTGFPPVDRQIESLGSHTVCLYPTATHLATAVNSAHYDGKAFELAMALGAPQLEIRFFDLAILEMYRNDPRYIYDCNDIGGWISVSDEHYKDSKMAERDKGVVESFGFAFNDDLHRGVAAFVCDLAQMSPEHQQIWRARER